MRMLVTGDWHLDRITVGIDRFEELERAVQATVAVAIDRRCQLYVFVGDAMDPDAGSASWRAIELMLTTALALEEADITSLWIAGNHDVIEDGKGTTTLTPMRALARSCDTVYVAERPVRVKLHGVDFFCFPFLATSILEREKAGMAALYAQMDALKKSSDVAVLGHLSVPGVEPGEEHHEMPRGDMERAGRVFPVEHCDSKWFLANGHYHRRQLAIPKPGLRVHIPGSLARLSFGEQAANPSFLVVDIGGSHGA